MLPQLCPDCCIELTSNKKKLGEMTNWLVCPKCGHRERPNNESIESKICGNAIDRIKQRNKNINQFNKENYE